MRKTGAFAALLFLLALAAIGSHDAARATSFTPINHTASLTNPAPSANSTVTVSITLDSPNALDDAHVSFIPSAWSVANDAAVPNGAIVGTVSLGISESVSNGPCNDSKFLNFTLYDSTTNTASNLLPDTPRIPSTTWPGFTVVNGVPDAVNKYPTFLKNAFPGLTPRSRAYGSVLVADVPQVAINRVVNVLVFDPGTPLPGMSPLSASLGFIVVVVAQDPTAPPAVSTITDQCSAFSYTREDRGLTLDNINTAANEGGVAYRTNPATPGSYKFFEYFRSQRDIDLDGIENALDSCPYVSTPSWNPRISDAINDFDGDGIPGQDGPQAGEQLLPGSGCDPTPLTAAADPDADGFTNRQDNCPLVANATQVDPDVDRIGSACDAVVTVPDGHLHEVCSSANVDVGAPTTPPALTCPKFVLDMDSDGYSDAAETGTPLCGNGVNDDDKTYAVYPGPIAADDAVIDDGCPGGPAQVGNFSEAQFNVGGDEQDPCGLGSWPSDFVWGSIPDSTNKVNILDLTSFIAPVASRRLDTSPGQPTFDKHWDLTPGRGVFNNMINVADLTALIAGPTGFPPMLAGARAFNGPNCPWP